MSILSYFLNLLLDKIKKYDIIVRWFHWLLAINEDTMAYNVWIVTHGDKFETADPGMTPKGKATITTFRPLIPTNPEAVVCGTGRRHLDVAEALELEPTRFTAVFGESTSLNTDKDGKKVIVLPCGKTIAHDPDVSTTVTDMAHATLATLLTLDQAVICAGRPMMIALDSVGVANSMKSASVYHVQHDGGKITSIIAIAEDGEVGAGRDEL